MNILFLGGDKRMSYAAECLAAAHNVCFSGESLAGRENFPVIVLPVPLTKDGKTVFAPVAPGAPVAPVAPGAPGAPLSPAPIPFGDVPRHAAPGALVLAGGSCPALSEVCAAHSLPLVNYFASETLTLRNAALTAESAVSLLADSCDGALLGSRVLITGFGRIARALALRLKPFGCNITIAARRRECRTEAELLGFTALPLGEVPLSDFDYIVNTVPAPLFTAEDFSHIKSGCVFLELATLPNSPPAPHIRYIHGGGLPGRCSPKTAGIFIAEELSRLLPDTLIERTDPSP